MIEKRHYSILVVDDEKDIVESARDVLEGMLPNCTVRMADSVSHAMAALEKEPFDAVLVDYRMPDRNGLDFIKQAREKEPQVAAILMTAYGNMDIAARAVNQCHVDGFLPKPLDALTLVETVRAALDRTTEVGANLQIDASGSSPRA
jgi:DNA-binding NtrC family response regulator